MVFTVVLVFRFVIDSEADPLFMYLVAVHEMPLHVFAYFIIGGLSSYYFIGILYVFWICVFCQL